MRNTQKSQAFTERMFRGHRKGFFEISKKGGLKINWGGGHNKEQKRMGTKGDSGMKPWGPSGWRMDRKSGGSSARNKAEKGMLRGKKGKKRHSCKTTNLKRRGERSKGKLLESQSVSWAYTANVERFSTGQQSPAWKRLEGWKNNMSSGTVTLAAERQSWTAASRNVGRKGTKQHDHSLAEMKITRAGREKLKKEPGQEWGGHSEWHGSSAKSNRKKCRLTSNESWVVECKIKKKRRWRRARKRKHPQAAQKVAGALAQPSSAKIPVLLWQKNRKENGCHIEKQKGQHRKHGAQGRSDSIGPARQKCKKGRPPIEKKKD